eukprot:g2342.t1
MIPAVPQFCVIGPMFHVFRDMFGGSSAAAVFATATCETLLAYGAETRNAQLAVCGKNAQLHNPLRPFGPGVSIHLARNALAMSGLRVLSDPCRRSLSTVCDMIGIKINDGVRTVVADLGANLIASALSMPLHQLYGFTVIEAAKRDNSKPKPSIREQITSAQSYLRRQFLVPGSNRISRLAWRDIVLRCSYNATIYTVYGAIERSSVALWKERGCGMPKVTQQRMSREKRLKDKLEAFEKAEEDKRQKVMQEKLISNEKRAQEIREKRKSEALKLEEATNLVDEKDSQNIKQRWRKKIKMSTSEALARLLKRDEADASAAPRLKMPTKSPYDIRSRASRRVQDQMSYDSQYRRLGGNMYESQTHSINMVAHSSYPVHYGAPHIHQAQINAYRPPAGEAPPSTVSRSLATKGLTSTSAYTPAAPASLKQTVNAQGEVHSKASVDASAAEMVPKKEDEKGDSKSARSESDPGVKESVACDPPTKATEEEERREREARLQAREKEMNDILQLDVMENTPTGEWPSLWYIMSEKWLRVWRTYVFSKEDKPRPGPLDNATLLEPLPGGATDEDGAIAMRDPKPNLVKVTDYRGVNRHVYSYFRKVYGGGPAIVRKELNIYAEKIDPGAMGKG